MTFLGEFLALFTALSWTTSSLIFENIARKIHPQIANFLRVCIGTFMLGVVCLFTKRHLFFPIDVPSNDLGLLLLSGFIGMFLGDFFLFKAFKKIGARITMLIMTLSPIIVALIDFIFLGVHLSVLQLTAIFITCLGVAIVILRPNNSENKITFNFSSTGLLYAFLATLGQSLGVILTKLGSTSYDSLATTQIRLIAAILGFGILILAQKKGQELISALKNTRNMFFICCGTFTSIFGIAALVEAFKHSNASVASTISSTSPILIIPISIIFFKEKIKKYEILGALISIIGISIFFF